MVIVPSRKVIPHRMIIFTITAQKIWCYFMRNTKFTYFGSLTTIIYQSKPDRESSKVSKIIELNCMMGILQGSELKHFENLAEMLYNNVLYIYFTFLQFWSRLGVTYQKAKKYLVFFKYVSYFIKFNLNCILNMKHI